MFDIKPAKGKHLSRLGAIYCRPRKWYEFFDWFYRKRLLKHYKKFWS